MGRQIPKQRSGRQLSVYAGDALQHFLEVRPGVPASRALNAAVARYAVLVRAHLPALSIDQWGALAQACAAQGIQPDAAEFVPSSLTAPELFPIHTLTGHLKTAITQLQNADLVARVAVLDVLMRVEAPAEDTDEAWKQAVSRVVAAKPGERRQR